MFLPRHQRMTRSLRAFGLALVCVSATTHLSQAQEYRPDPFLPTMSPQEDKKALEREKLKEVMRELFPEIRSSMIMPEIASARTQIVEEAKRSSLTAMHEDPAFLARPAAAAPGLTQVSTGDASAKTDDGVLGEASIDGAVKGVNNKMPDGVKFVACVDDKALYVDKNTGLRFFRELPPNAPSICKPIHAYVPPKDAKPAGPAIPGMVTAGMPGVPPMNPGAGPTLASAPARPVSQMPPRPVSPMPTTARPNATFQQPKAQVVPVVGTSR